MSEGQRVPASDTGPGAVALADSNEPRPDAPSVLELALAFNRLAFESVGGGLAAWSQHMIVEERRWLSEEEYLSASTICSILPGTNQVNMAVFVGARYRGALGATAAVLGLIAFPAAAALLAGYLYLRYREVAWLRHVLAGMSCAAVGLTFSVAWRQARHTLNALAPIVLFAATFAASAWVRAPLWLTMAILVPAGFLWAWHNRAVPEAAPTENGPR